MKQNYQVELSHILWNLAGQKDFITPEGQKISIIGRGEYDEKRERFAGAQVQINGETHHGDIAIWAGKEMPKGDFESTVLHVAPCGSASILKSDGQPIPQILAQPDPVCSLKYEMLRSGNSNAGCSPYIAGMEKHERIALFTRLMADRLYRKYTEVMTVFEKSEQNWNETLYVMLFRAMGKPYNTEAFGELAERVKYKYICRERGAVQNAEALLLGASGLLEVYEDDQYIRDLKDTFTHYCRKHKDISPMRAGEWATGKQYGNGIPVLRLAQLASFFTKRDLLVDPVIKCNKVEDIHRFFDIEASVYWSTHYKPGETGAYRLKKLGHDKANTLGINFIVPMKFAYGVYMGDEQLKEEALGLLEKINPESNKLVDNWRKGGTLTENAFDSQAVIQLNNEYCFKGLCWKCPVGKRVIKGVYKQQSAQKM